MESDTEVISRLKFIGKIQKSDKINVKYLFVQPDGILTRIYRTLFNIDNRQNTLTFIRNTIDRSFEIISSYSKSNDDSKKRICLHVITDLKNAKNGLINLKETYVSDIKFVCDINTFLQEIDARLFGLSTPVSPLKHETIKPSIQRPTPIKVPIKPSIQPSPPLLSKSIVKTSRQLKLPPSTN